MSQTNVQVTEALTRKVAELARLELTDTEVQTFTPQLNTVLGYINQLGELDVAGVEPLSHPHEYQTALRDDRLVTPATDSDGRPKTLACAPEVLDDGFKVPPIL